MKKTAAHTYKFVKLIRVNFSAVGGVLNFITFQAKDGKPGSHPQNFQTRVYQCIEKTEVQFCRLEQKKSTLPEETSILEAYTKTHKMLSKKQSDKTSILEAYTKTRKMLSKKQSGKT
ncbi:uncharacterized protein LOC131331095 isoform X4 [Rhododendron vialii]|uniref:uncharacterized protein LOC131331095 isoform X4 n=1 Tax=Rhododendron vialii TaxID=182163 RepID=UPI00265D74A5|nr:uncharacterized protein LOC131331095 isoform X4 [Rhododendron vialii]